MAFTKESTILKLQAPAVSGFSLAPSRCVLLSFQLFKPPGAHGGFSSRLRSSSGCRTVGVDESGQFALQLPDRSRRTMGVSDGSGRLAPTGAVFVSDRSGSPASTTRLRSVVGVDESGQLALQLPDRSRRTMGVSDGSGRLTPTGATSVSDRSGSPAFEAWRLCVDVSDESGRLAPTGTMPPVTDRVSLRTGSPAVPSSRLRNVGGSGRSALQLPDRPRRQSDKSGRLAPSGAMSAFNRSGRLIRRDRFGVLGDPFADTVFLGGRGTVDSDFSGQPAP